MQFQTIFQNDYVKLETDNGGLLYETTNAATRQLVCSALFVGCDWIRMFDKLINLFNRRFDIALRYIAAAKDEDKDGSYANWNTHPI